MERTEIARAVRRRYALEAIDDEKQRERVLADQLDEIIAEADGPALDAAVFETMEPTEVRLLQELFGDALPADRDELESADFFEEDGEDEESVEEEIVRLQTEIRRCQRRVRALERYIEGLDAVSVDGAPREEERPTAGA